jgi:hypothetical protein
MSDTSYISDLSIMSYTSNTSNEYQLCMLTSDFETRLAVPAFCVISYISDMSIMLYK